MKSEKRAWLAIFTGTLIAVGGGAIAAPPAWTQPSAPQSQGAGGDILRAEASQLAVSAPGLPGTIPAKSIRLTYASSDTHNAPTTVVGTYLEPMQPWTGPGERPLVAYAGGTQGQSAECAPSAMVSQVVRIQPPADVVFEYDIIAIYQLLARGMAVVMTDYHDFGTPGVHNFLNRKTQGYAVLDSARAALRLPDTGFTPASPVILYGYSQGGMASAAAAELQAEYAPDLNVRGAYVGGLLTGPQDFIARSDGRSGVAPAIGWILNGIAADYPDTRPVLDAALNDTGRAIMHDSIGKCGGGLSSNFAHPQNTSRWTTSGLPLTAVIDGSPELKRAFDEQRLGGFAPSVPVRIYSARNDEGAPYPAVRGIAANWCGGGAAVQLDSDASVPAIPAGFLGTHDVAFFPSLMTSQQWVTDRLADVPAPVNCAALP
ncbi:lipase family protein [Nocardia jinanensis]|uniref:Triacylglycerol lipase n=1 Tax=Nocardia jinanensis TaxID=382504 RepID=A0A917VSR6_9NOCA|nr:lipase family protein [Nocardia jinanensis]GGL10443.1 triacylglycerol lipase [Nocardia jinanensis]